MTAAEFEALLDRIARGLRLRRAVTGVFPLAAGLLAADLVAVLAVKAAAPAGAGALVAAVTALAAGLPMGALGVLYLLRPVSTLRAAAELDRLAGLKERASSLVAVRTGAVRAGPLATGLESDAAGALAPLRAEELLRQLAPLPARSRWLGVLLAAALAALLVPSRRREREASLADVLLGGPELVAALESGAAAQKAADSPAAKSTRRVLVILKKKPPREAAGAERGQKDFKELAAALRRQGRRELARKVEDAARVVAGLAGPRESGTGAGERARPRPADLGRYPAEYADLLARYFGESS